MTEETYLDKPLPSNVDSEQAVLGSIILENGLYEVPARLLGPEDFYNPFHRFVWTAMTELYLASRPILPNSIVEVWKSQGINPDTLGGMVRVMNLTFGVPLMGPKEIREEATIVKRHSIARQAIRACTGITNDLIAGLEDVPSIMQRFESKALRLSSELHTEDKSADKPFDELSEIVPAMRQQFQDYHEGKSNGVPTGMKKLDLMLDGGGLQDGGLYIIAAGEKAGKTSLALDWISEISIIQQLGWTAIVTGEMSKVTMSKRLYSPWARIPYWKFRPGMYDSPDDPVYTKAISELDRFGRGKVMIADRLFSVGQISRHLRRKVEAGHKDPRKKVVLGMIDYLQLIELEDRGRASRTEEVEKVTRAFKLLATDLGIPLIAISSMNRLGLQDGQVPDTFNLRQAGTIGYDAEAVMFLHNPAYVPGQPYEPQEVTPMNLILSRQRNGPTGVIPVMFVGPYMQFMTVDDYERLLGPRDTDNVIPKSKETEAREEEDLMSLW
jgi:replicative DNA helicase